jgi:tetratricopeptide (TPR) repeat protein
MDPVSIEDIILAAKRCYHADQFSECARLCEQVVKRSDASDSDRSTALHLLGDVYLDLERFELAERVYGSLIEIEKSDVAYANRGFSLLSQGKWELALRDYLNAVQLNPKNLVAAKFTAECYISLGRPNEAIELLLKSANENADYADAFRVLGIAYSKRDMWFDAYKAFDRALSIDPEDGYSKRAIEQIENLTKGEGEAGN